MSSCLIQESTSCSAAFDGVEQGVTIVYAVITAMIMLVCIPVNVILLTAVIVHYEYLEDSFICVISTFASNIMITIFFGGGILLSSAMRNFPFGYAECQVIGFLALAGLSSRWVAMGVFSFDRVMRIFRPFCYAHWSKYVSKILVTVPWFLVVIHVPLLANFGGRIDYVDHFPTCLINHHCEDRTCFGIQIAWTMWCFIFGALMPMVFFTLMCVKSNVVKRADRSVVMGHFGESPDSPREETARSQADDSQATNPFQVGDSQANLAQWADSRANRYQVNRSQINRPKLLSTVGCRVFTTYFWTMVNISFSMLVLVVVILSYTTSVNHMPFLIMVCSALTDCYQVYVITDFILVWKNTEGKEVLRRLYRAFRVLLNR